LVGSVGKNAKQERENWGGVRIQYLRKEEFQLKTIKSRQSKNPLLRFSHANEGRDL